MKSEQFKQRAKTYPHAVKYITEKGILEAATGTLETWEHEASICSAVEIAVAGKDAVGRLTCPHCSGDLFRYGDALVNYAVPFVSQFRIGYPNFLPAIFRFKLLEDDGEVQCMTCSHIFKKRVS